MPNDLYIPPDALKIFLETFEGPLDLLLYLIKHQNLDILDIPIVKITQQYMQYIDLMTAARFDLAGEYLLMAATLAEIKSRMLLPRKTEEGEADETDPRARLVQQLQTYARYKQAAEDFDDLPRMERDIRPVTLPIPDNIPAPPLPDVDVSLLREVFVSLLERIELASHHQISSEPLSVRERMSMVLEKLTIYGRLKFEELFTLSEGRMGVVVTFLAILELAKYGHLNIIQEELFGSIIVERPE